MKLNFFKRYPAGFSGLFLTQVFYICSFYGLKSIFVLYAISQFSFSEKEAVSLYAAFMALSYACSLIGGWIADKSLGIKHTLYVGGCLHISGVLCLMFSAQQMCFAGMALISLGSGFFKPNLSTAVGMLFEDPKDPKKDKTYSAYYLAMNLGSFVAPLLCGFIGRRYGWPYGLGLFILSVSSGLYFFHTKSNFKYRKQAFIPESDLLSNAFFVGILLVMLLSLFYFLFQYRHSFNHLMGIIALGSFIYLGKVFYECNRQERADVLMILLYILIFAFFCSLFEQAGSSLMLFFEKAVDRQVLGIEFPSSTLFSLGSIFVIICSPLLMMFCERVLEKDKPMDGLVKIMIGFLFVSLSFFILMFGCWQEKGLVSPFWVGGALLIQTIGELLIVPIGFANVSKLSPPRFQSIMMSFWLMAIAYGSYFSGFIARSSLVEGSASSEISLEHYRHFFYNLGLMPLGAVFLLFVVVSLKKILLRKKK
jgi:POT family proton-dependent oligopeptide transporter